MQSSSTASARRPSTVASTKSSNDGRKHALLKEHFTYKHGLRHHSYDSEKAPYPLSYDRHVLELESMDNRFIRFLRSGSVSFCDFENDEPPERVLDLGCGTGNWVIEAANDWPNANFVGFDLVNVQIPTKILDHAIANRISWVHGNFLTTKLPFDDDEFDHIHVQYIAKGVPENKWGNLFEEILRVMRPSGTIEILEEDALFPLLPKWFTAPLRSRPRRALSVHLPDGSHRGVSPTPENHDEPNHDHALLEDLYSSVYEHRFINQRPTALLPNYITTYFHHVKLGALLKFPMPPMPPPQPLPPPIVTSYVGSEFTTSEDLDPRSSGTISSPPPSTRQPSLSFSSTISSTSTAVHSYTSTPHSANSRLQSPSFSSIPPPEGTPFPEIDKDDDLNGHSGATDYGDEPQVPVYVADNSISRDKKPLVFVSDKLEQLNQRSLAMHLYKSYQTILACQEALWEELKDRLRNRRDELKPYGWDDDEELEELQNRKRFERLIERYRSDMQSRVALWCSLNEIGWDFPPRDPLSRAERIEEERVRDEMLEARRCAVPEDLRAPSRAMRVITAQKV